MEADRRMSIYALKDPRTQEIRYVGRSENVAGRYSEHCRGKSYGSKSKNGPLTPWITELIAQNLKPELCILEELSSDTWEGRELYWIKELLQKGEPLLNARNERRGKVCQPLEPRFWKRVNKQSGIFRVVNGKESECWIWTGASSKTEKYGMFHHSGDDETPRANMLAHRFSYELHNGRIPEEKRGKRWHVDHLCRTRSCVRPDHLELIPRKENILRGSGITAVNAAKTHCGKGHEYNEENTYVSKKGCRHCKACQKEKEQKTLYGTDHVFRATHCTHGHEFTPENSYFDPRGVRFCVPCRRARAEAVRLARPVVEKPVKIVVKPEPKVRVLKTHCPQGHEYSPENTRIVNGSRLCRICARASVKASLAKRLADPEKKAAYMAKHNEETRRRRAKTHVEKAPSLTCRRGHAWTPENEEWFQGARHCKQCRLDRRQTERAGRVRKPHFKSIVTHCPRGHEYNEANTRITRTGARECRACMPILQKAYRDRLRQRLVA